LRRAARHGRLLGITEPFLYRYVRPSSPRIEMPFPSFLTTRPNCQGDPGEEERFARTIDQGMELLNALMENVKSR
jgi:alanyl-tRNA synthetase